jgi:hypothetical protein
MGDKELTARCGLSRYKIGEGWLRHNHRALAQTKHFFLSEAPISSLQKNTHAAWHKGKKERKKKEKEEHS